VCLYRVFQISELWTIFWTSAPKFRSNWEFLLSKGVVNVRREEKQLNNDINILHQVDLEFDVDSKNRIKNLSSHLKNYKFGLLGKFGTPCILMDYRRRDTDVIFLKFLLQTQKFRVRSRNLVKFWLRTRKLTKFRLRTRKLVKFWLQTQKLTKFRLWTRKLVKFRKNLGKFRLQTLNLVKFDFELGI